MSTQTTEAKHADPLREKYLGMRNAVTLDGQPAYIVGWMAKFPQVRHYSATAPGYSYCRETIDRILDNGGAFKT